MVSIRKKNELIEFHPVYCTQGFKENETKADNNDAG